MKEQCPKCLNMTVVKKFWSKEKYCTWAFCGWTNKDEQDKVIR